VSNVIDAAGSEVCENITITKYGVVECLTRPIQIAQTSDLKVKLESGDSYGCINTDATKC